MIEQADNLIPCSVVTVSYQVPWSTEAWPWPLNMLKHRIITTAILLSDYWTALRRRDVPQNFRLSKIGSKIRYIQWTKLGDILCILLFASRVPPILRNKRTFERKVGYKSCSTFPLNLGIYYSRAFWACNKHFNKDLIEAFKCFKYMQPQTLIFFRKIFRTSKALYINVGLADLNK